MCILHILQWQVKPKEFQSHDILRQLEINGGVNVIERWNGATDFVRFARRGEFVINL